MMRGRDIVCMSSLDWEDHWTSKQQIMLRLSETNRVLYVEEPVTALAPLRVPSRWDRWKAVVPGLRKVNPGLWVLTPPPVSPFGNMYPSVNRGNQRLLAGYVNWALREIGMEDPILWTYLPGSYALIDRLCPRAVVYHCVDEHSAFPGFIRPGVVKGYDDLMTKRADLVLTTARNLLLSREHLNPHIYHVPHGADIQHFATALDPSLAIPADIAAIPRPRIGAVGVQDNRLDIAAVEALVGADPTWHVVLVGPVLPGSLDEDRLRSLPNVHLLGNKSVAELPAYLKALDIALIPYRLDELTRNIFPLKMYEYLAAGLPVVAGPLPELRPYAGRISLAEAPEDYPALVREALATETPEARISRSASVAGETWDARVEQISTLVEEMLERTSREGAGRAADGRPVCTANATSFWGSLRSGGLGAGEATDRPAHAAVLGFRLDLLSLEAAAEWVAAAADGVSGASSRSSSPPRTAIAVSFNPELVMAALEDPTAAEALRAADLCYPDGVGAVWAVRRKLEPGGPALDPGPQRVAGIDLAQRVLESAAHTGTPVYFLGARPGIAEEAARRQCASLPGLRVVGCRDGYFSPDDEAAVVDRVRASGAAILLVAMGAPKQEKLLFRHRDEWGAAVALGVGGSFDVWAGNTRRAPEWVRKVGVEWLYRLASEPKRLRRQLVLPRFVYRVIAEQPEPAGNARRGDVV